MKLPEIDAEGAARRLGGMLAIPTVSGPDAPEEMKRFADFHRYLEEKYPLAHRAMERQTVAGDALLYLWRGLKNGAKPPFGLLAHMDVVPVEPGTEKDWTYPPFSGEFDGTHVWGRGAADDKCQIAAVFEAAESLLAAGFAPQTDIYICLGCNEEVAVGGDSSAKAIAGELKSRGVRLGFVLDEGGAVLAEPPFGLKFPAAMVGVAEKGYADVKVTVRSVGGHAAQPPARTALGNLGRMLAAIEDHPQRPRLIPTVLAMFSALSRRIGGMQGFLLSHIKWTKPLVLAALESNRMVSAMLRTTAAPTQAQGSPQANVLPQAASAVLNCRLLPGDTEEALLARLRAIASKRKLDAEFELLRSSPAPAETSVDSPVYRSIERLADDLFGAVAVPYLLTGATDSREYAGVADEIFRIYPFLLDNAELNAMHGTNERIKASSLKLAIEFMRRFITEQAEG